MSKEKAPDYQAPPPVKERPKCGYCGKPLQPLHKKEWKSWRVNTETGFTTHGHFLDHGFQGDYHGYGNFCRLRCAARFANAAYKAGFRNAL
jgi:hypothetical protein